MPDAAVLLERPPAAAPAPSPPPVERVLRALHCHGERARTAACWAHPSWLAVPLGIDAAAAAEVQHALRGCAPRAVQACSAELLRHWCVEPVDLSVLAASARRPAAAAALLSLVPESTGLRMLRMRALLGHLDRLRRTIDRAARERLSAALGLPLAEFVARAATATRPAASQGIGPMDDESLAGTGWRALAPAPNGLCALALPRALACAPAEGADAALDASWAALLPEFFPEWTWLFG